MSTLSTPLLILGADGMLGQDLARELAQYQPVLWDKAQLDITDASAMERALNSLRPAVVINTAAYNAVDQAESEAGFGVAVELNAKAPERLAQWCSQHNAIFIHYSSDYVFPGTNRAGYSEDAEPQPLSRYGESKRMGEQAVLTAGGQGYVIRTCKLFGRPGVSAQSKKSFVDTMRDLAKIKPRIDVVDAEFASPAYTVDVAAQTHVLLQGALTGMYAPGIYHITNTGACTWYECAKEIFAHTGDRVDVQPITSAQYPRPATRPAYSVLLNTKLPPMRHWKEALKEYLQEDISRDAL